jgi:hypothetical protein
MVRQGKPAHLAIGDQDQSEWQPIADNAGHQHPPVGIKIDKHAVDQKYSQV